MPMMKSAPKAWAACPAAMQDSTDGFGSVKEGILEGFALKYAGVPITIFVVLSVPVLFLHDAVMNALLNAGAVTYTTIIYAILMAVIFLTSSIAGCAIWFYPLERLANIYLLLASAAIFFAYPSLWREHFRISSIRSVAACANCVLSATA